MNTKLMYKRLLLFAAVMVCLGACKDDETSVKAPGEILGITLKDASNNDVHIDAFESSLEELTATAFVPGPTDVKKLTPYFTLNEGSKLLYNSSVAYDGKQLDFSTPATAQVKGPDGAVKEYKIIVQRSGKSGYISNVIFAEGVQPNSVEISQINKTIDIYFPKGANLEALKPTFVIEDGASLLGNIPNGGERNMVKPIKVTIKGTNYAETEYTVTASMPKLAFDQIMFQGVGSAAACGSLVVSNNKLVLLADWNSSVYRYMDLTTGVYDDADKLIAPTGMPYGYGNAHLRKFAKDDKGVILSMHLSMSDGLVAYKWDNLTATPEKYIDVTWASMGITTKRLAGLTVTGDLSADAKIFFVNAGSKKLITFTVTGGVLNATPTVTDIKTSGLGNYASFISVTGSTDFLLARGDLIDGLTEYYDKDWNLLFSYSGFSSNGKTFDYEGRKYLAIAITDKTAKNKYEIYDISDPNDVTKCKTPVFSQEFPLTGGTNANAIMDADYAIINGQLHVYFVGVNGPYICYRFK